MTQNGNSSVLVNTVEKQVSVGIKIFPPLSKKRPCVSLKLLLTIDRFRLGGATLKFLKLFFASQPFTFKVDFHAFVSINSTN